MKTKISRFICAITLTVIQVQTSNAQDLQKIANLHLKATTQEKRSEIRSIFMEVREIYDDGHVTEYSIIKKKPNKIRIEGVWEGKNYIKAFDGIRGWTIAPWTGVSIPQLMTEGEIEEIRNIERIDSPIFESLNEGHQMSLIEDKMINGERFYCVRVVASHRPVVDYLINKNDYLLYKSLRYNINNIQELEEEVFYKDYKKQAEIMLPTSYEIRRDGKSVDIVIKEMIIGFGAPDSFFKKPE